MLREPAGFEARREGAGPWAGGGRSHPLLSADCPCSDTCVRGAAGSCRLPAHATCAMRHHAHLAGRRRGGHAAGEREGAARAPLRRMLLQRRALHLLLARGTRCSCPRPRCELPGYQHHSGMRRLRAGKVARAWVREDRRAETPSKNPSAPGRRRIRFYACCTAWWLNSRSGTSLQNGNPAAFACEGRGSSPLPNSADEKAE
jgi:hypothetical protein